MSIKRFVSALLTGALCLGVLTACGSTQKPASSGVSADAQRYSTIFYDAFDTVTQVIAYCDSEEEFSRQMDALHADLLEYHRLYDIYNDYDGVVNVKTINDNAGVAPVQVDDKILGMLELARQMYDTTNGKLNIAMGSVLRIWHDYREAAEANTNEADNKLPEQEALDAAARHCDISNLVIDENARTVYLSDRRCPLMWAAWARLRRGDGGTGRRGPGPEKRPHQRGRQPPRHRHEARRLPVVGRRGEPVERLGRLHCQLFLCLRCQHERYGSRHQRQLPALLRRGRRALPPPHRPGYPLARPLL